MFCQILRWHFQSYQIPLSSLVIYVKKKSLVPRERSLRQLDFPKQKSSVGGWSNSIFVLHTLQELNFHLKIEKVWKFQSQLLHQVCACVLSCFNRVRLFATMWTVACQAPLLMGFSQQEYWSGFPFPPPEIFWPRDQTLVSCLSCIARQVLYH